MEDERYLIQQVLSGDDQAVLDFVRRYQNLVRHVVFRLVDDPMEREERCQDTFVKALEALPFFRAESKLTTWIGRIAYREAAQHLRKRNVPLVYASEGDVEPDDIESPSLSAAGRLEREELREFVRDSIELLSPAQQTAVTMFYLEELEVSEIAELMSVPVNTVKSHLSRSRKKLRELLIEEATARGYTT